MNILRDVIDEAVLAIAGKRAHTDPKKKLFVLIGEEHDTPSHILAAQGIVAELTKRFNVSVGLEHSYNAAPSDQKSLADFLTITRYEYAAETQRNFAFFCEQNKISMSCNDLPYFDHARAHSLDFSGPALDLKDQRVKKAIKDSAFILPEGKIDATYPEGMLLRDRAMSAAALSHARQNDADIYIQRLGCAHLFGQRRGVYKYDSSFSGWVQKDKQAVLPVVLGKPSLFFHFTRKADNMIAKGEALCRQDLPTESFNYARLGKFERQTKRLAERRYINVLASESGLNVYV